MDPIVSLVFQFVISFSVCVSMSGSSGMGSRSYEYYSATTVVSFEGGYS